MSNATGWQPTHDANGRTPEGAAFEAQVDALKRRVFPAAVREDAVRKALRGLPRGVPIFNRAGEFVGATPAERLLPATGATARALAVRKAKGQPPLVAAYDATGSLVGLVEQGDVLTLGKGESYSYDVTGALVGIVSASGQLRPIAIAAQPSPSAGDAAVAALSPEITQRVGVTPAAVAKPPPTLGGKVMDGADRNVAKARTDQLVWAHGELARRERAAVAGRTLVFDPAGATSVLCSVGKQWAKQRVEKRMTVPAMSPLEAGLRGRLAMAPAERSRFDAKLAQCPPSTRAALGRSPVLKQAGLGAPGVLRALGAGGTVRR
jgi:hypothetical protein